MLRGAGFIVHDLGVDTAPDEFIDAIDEHQAEVLGMSALLTTTMPNMGRTIEAFEDEGMRDKVFIMVGGAPVTEEFAEDMGADGYGIDAISCVDLAKSFNESNKYTPKLLAFCILTVFDVLNQGCQQIERKNKQR